MRSEKEIKLSLKELEKQFNLLHEILITYNVNIVIPLPGFDHDMPHVIGVCYDCESKNWLLIDSSKFNLEPFNNIKELYQFIFYSLTKL